MYACHGKSGLPDLTLTSYFNLITTKVHSLKEQGLYTEGYIKFYGIATSFDGHQCYKKYCDGNRVGNNLADGFYCQYKH